MMVAGDARSQSAIKIKLVSFFGYAKLVSGSECDAMV